MDQVVWEDLDPQWEVPYGGNCVRDTAVMVSISLYGCDAWASEHRWNQPKGCCTILFYKCWLMAVNLDTDLPWAWTLWVL